MKDVHVMSETHVARHIHQYALCTGFSSVLAWIYPIMFFVLLSHRQHRIEQKGRRDYVNWDEYCAKVPYRFLPYIY